VQIVRFIIIIIIIIIQGNYNVKKVEIINSFGGKNPSLFDVFIKTLNSV